jgi:serine/threonine protein phosphatase PrpC
VIQLADDIARNMSALSARVATIPGRSVIGIELPNPKREAVSLSELVGSQAFILWVGDSRVYHLRNGQIVTRTRDHSHVELLLQEGLISAHQAMNHPMRNFVETCLGGDPMLPEMRVGRCVPLQTNDSLPVCTDGFWANLLDEDIAASFYSGVPLKTALQAITEFSVRRAGVGADNSSAAVMRLL